MSRSKKKALTASQQSALTHSRGPCLVLAGPGSGKTTVLVERVVFLIESLSLSPSSILVLTFSRKAALEMQERFLSRTGGSYPDVTFGTFHSVFYQILRLSTGRDLTLISEKDRLALVRGASASSFGPSGHVPAAEQVLSAISAFKEGGPSALPEAFRGEGQQAFSSLLSTYQDYLSENDLLDYDDMILGCRSLFAERPDLLARWQDRFRFLLVDEFQDISRGQYALIRALAGRDRNVFAVGDDDQSIYGFRGASPSVMRDFLRDFPGTVTISLSDNFRSTRRIVRMAGKVIACNRDRFPKKIRAARREEGRIPEIRSFVSVRDQDQALIEKLKALPVSELEETAVICRDHVRLRRISEALAGAGIPVPGLEGRPDPLEAELVSDLQTYVRLAGQAGRGALKREDLMGVLNRPVRYLTRESLPGPVLSLRDLQRPGAPSALVRLARDLSLLSRMPAGRTLSYIIRGMGYGAFAAERAGLKGKDLPAFLVRLEEAGKGAASLSDLALVLEESAEGREKGGGPAGEGVRLLTMHASKGLEFDRVFLPDLNDVILPGRRCRTRDQEEEERRLFYVALTRARNELHLYYIRGREGDRLMPSRFLLPLGVRP